ncbi:MAG TPA: hypothetical protein VHE56_02775, partial [Mycobacteriales bacterium]|nr:hypothetical protein [Mycobacteriales bacterium]
EPADRAPAAPAGEAAAPQPRIAAPSAPAPVVAEPEPEPAPSAASSGGVDLSALRRLWDSVLDAVKTQSRTAHALMLSSQIESLDANNLVLAFSSSSLASRFTADVSPILTQALKDIVGVDLRVSATGGGALPPKLAAEEPDSAPVHSPAPEITADDMADSDDLEGSTDADPEAAALALLQDGLGAQVIGEIDQS